jgi:DNA polymerase
MLHLAGETILKTLHIDLETFSSVDLTTCGAHAYVESPDFEIILFGYAFDDEPVTVIETFYDEELMGPLNLCAVDMIPLRVQEALFDPNTIKIAYNAPFERICLAKVFEKPMPPAMWRCSMVHALTLGLPAKLEATAKVLKLQEQKDTAGKALINYFCKPCKPTRTNGGRVRNLPHHAPDKWTAFREYNRQDVEAERAVGKALERFPLSPSEQLLWVVDQQINDRGVRVNYALVDQAIRCDTRHHLKAIQEAIDLTGLSNPNSVAQLKAWLQENEGIAVDSLSKDTVPEILERTQNDTTRRVLELRQESSKTSVKKYEAMQRARCEDDRVRGLLQFYGANRTGRWAGRLIQIHNLPKNSLSDLDLARKTLLMGDYETLEMLWGNVPDVLSQLVRTAFEAPHGHKFIVSDFSSIEARIVAWLAGEKWRLDVFRGHGKIYEASASQMFKVPIESITKTNPLRQKGKIAELALGYGGGVRALIIMGALKMGLTEEELPDLVKVWRAANQAITKFWWDVEKAAIAAVVDRTTVNMRFGMSFIYEAGILFVKLPSGRKLSYIRPKVKYTGPYDKPELSYEGVDQTTKQWARIDTYGPKLVENITQAVARDCLGDALLRLHQAKYKIVMHVHDEVILEVPEAQDCLKNVNWIMSQPIEWAPGLPLGADGFETTYYRKD